MNRPGDLGQLTPRERNQLHTILELYARAWQEGDSVALADFVPPVDVPFRAVVFQELVKADLEQRWQRQQEIYLEDYCRGFPDFMTSQTVPPLLLYQEYCVRGRYGDSPELASYQARFPSQFADFQRLVRERPPLTIVPAAPVAEAARGTLKPAEPGSDKPAEPVKRDVLSVGGGYAVIKRLGSGSFGEVWRAEAPGGVEVAIKIVHRPLDHKEAQRELQALELIKGLRHNYLLQTQAYWSLEDRLLIVMDLADGSLRDRLQHCRGQGKTGIPVDELLTYFREAAEALDFLHDKQVQHRDIKPDNILLLGRHVKVADFGLARLQRGVSMVTATGSGTPAYMAPEIWNNKVHYHSDQYSLAATYAELRLDRRLFPGDNLAELMMATLQATPNLAPLAKAEQEVLHRALAKDPNDRYPTCREFVQALEEAVHPKEKPEPRPGSRILLWAVVLTAGLALSLLLLAFYFRPRSEPARHEVDWLPAGIEPEADAQIVTVDAMKLYDHVARVTHGKRIPFRLIPHEAESDPMTFYMMENKVSNELFALAMNDPEFRKLQTDEERAHPGTIKGQWTQGGLGSEQEDKDQLPVLRVTVTEAYLFARWLGGYLPSVKQWDKAGGGLNGDPRPCLPPPWERDDIAINRGRKGPMPVGTAAKDISRFKCRDLAGNGREWTITLRDAGLTVPAAKPENKLLVVLRGSSYDAPNPFLFTDRRESMPYLDPSPFISFRVVLRLSPTP
jgi:hypothetical protein